MLIYEKISSVVSLALIGLALYFVLSFPSQLISLELLGSPLALASPQRWLMVILLGGLVMAGTNLVMRSHPHLPSTNISYLATFWMLPALLLVLATQTLGLAPSPISWAFGLVVVGLLLWLTILTQYRQLDPASSGQTWLQFWQQLIGFAVSLLFFIVIYQTRSRGLVSATAIMFISAMTALALLRQSPEMIQKSWLFAAIIGLSLGQITWALNYWRIDAFKAGLLLFLVFYVSIGLSRQQLFDTITRRALLEFGAISAIALAVILNL